MKRAVLAGLMALTILFGVSSAALATPGTSTGSGDVTVTVQNVWNYEYYQLLPGSGNAQTRDIDCPSGTEVVTGFGVWVLLGYSDASQASGTALDADTWRVTFTNNLGFTVNSILQVHATCA